jgi:hypothetical protein
MPISHPTATCNYRVVISLVVHDQPICVHGLHGIVLLRHRAVPHVEIPVLPDSLGVTHCLPIDTQVFHSATGIRGIRIRQDKQLIRERQGSPTQRVCVEGALERVVVEG